MKDVFEYFPKSVLSELNTTAKYPNRVKDKRKIEEMYDLPEFGNEFRHFYTKNGTILAIGYNRVVYGDHGPYVEFEASHFKRSLISKFNNKCPISAYYEWMTVDDGSDIKVYRQLRDVHNLPNPPYPGFRGNRLEGYADYLQNKYYISPHECDFRRE